MGGDGRDRQGRFVAVIAFVGLVLASVGNADARPGDLDPTFGTGGRVTTTILDWNPGSFVTQLMRDEHGRIIAAGMGAAGAVLARYSDDGTLDPTFGSNGVTVDPRLYWRLPPPFALAADGRIYAGGFTANEEDAILLRYDAQGLPDQSFGVDGVLIHELAASEIVPLSDGTLLVAGDCRATHGSGVMRLLADGTADPTFVGGCQWLANGGFRTLGMPTPDTIVAAANGYTHGNPLQAIRIGHFLANGSSDPAFAQTVVESAPLPFHPVLMRVQSDGRVLAIDEGNEGTMQLVRLNSDGSLDATFGIGGIVTLVQPWGWGSGVGALALQRDARILIAGVAAVAGHDDVDVFVARLLPDGTLDPSFGDAGIVTTDIRPAGYDQDVAYALLEQPDGKIVAGGASLESDDHGPIALARYLGTPCGDGTRDPGEACDDGAVNGTAASCCANDCTVRADGAACVSSNACVEQTACLAGACVGSAVACPACTACAPASGCVFAPRTDCAPAASAVRAALDVRRGRTARGHRLTFAWKGEGAFPPGATGDGTSSASYALCVYDRVDEVPTLRLAARAPGDGTCGQRPCWRRKGDVAVYRDRRSDADGVDKIRADATVGTIQLSGKGGRLDLPELPLATPVTAELRVEGGGCWQLDAAAASVRRNSGDRYRVTLP